jgi:hypothetical protein
VTPNVYERALDRIDHLGGHGWSDRDAEGTVRNILLGLRHQGLLDRKALLADMQARGHDADALDRLAVFIDKTYRERG